MAKRLDQATGIDGILSMKFFERQGVTIDFRSRTLTIENDSTLRVIRERAEVVPLYEQKYRDVALDVFVPLLFNGSVRVLAEFDTGSGIDVLVHPFFMTVLQINTLAAEVTIQTYTRDDGQQQTTYATRLRTIELLPGKSIRMDNPHVTFMQNLIYEGLIDGRCSRTMP
jgi:hypothetical protein